MFSEELNLYIYTQHGTKKKNMSPFHIKYTVHCINGFIVGKREDGQFALTFLTTKKHLMRPIFIHRDYAILIQLVIILNIYYRN